MYSAIYTHSLSPDEHIRALRARLHYCRLKQRVVDEDSVVLGVRAEATRLRQCKQVGLMSGTKMAYDILFVQGILRVVHATERRQFVDLFDLILVRV